MSLSSIARSKLSASSSANLHRWVLLKNSLMASSGLAAASHPGESHTPPNSPTSSTSPFASSSSSHIEPDSGFMFPTYYSYSDHDRDTPARSSEALWLDTLLESLAHDEEDEVEDPHVGEDDDDEEEDDEEAIMLSPMSSSDDLSQHPQYYSRTLAPLTLPFPFSDLDLTLDDSSDDGEGEGEAEGDALKSSSSSTSSTSPSSSASSLPPSTPPSSPLKTWTVPSIPLQSLSSPSIQSSTPLGLVPKDPHVYIDAYSDPLPFSPAHTFSRTFHDRYELESPFVFHADLSAR